MKKQMRCKLKVLRSKRLVLVKKKKQLTDKTDQVKALPKKLKDHLGETR